MRAGAITTSSDPGREAPSGLGARLDCIHAALDTLEDEERRLRRLGFEAPLARCREAARFWRFLDGLHSLAAREREIGESTPRGWVR